ncbi:MAG: hypothetical protein ACTSU4_13410 [Promethearchaeota archaeon]
MKYKKTSLLIAFILVFFPISTVVGYENVEKISESTSAFFLVNLNKGELLEIKVESLEGGWFGLFLFDERPEETHVNFDGTLDNEIYNKAILYDIGNEPTLIYIAENTQIYYIQLILLENGPDTYIITSNRELSRYYLPQLHGYSIPILLVSVISTMVFLFVKYKNNLNE